MSAVSEIMSRKQVVKANLEPKLSALDAAKLMSTNRVSSVVMVDRNDKPVGIITDRDLRKVLLSNKSPQKTRAHDIMSSPVISIKSYDSIESAAAVMKEHKIKRLVVLEQDGSLAGMISASDITRKLGIILTDEYERYGKLKTLIDSE